MYKYHKTVSILLLIAILSQLLLMPDLAHAQQIAALPPQATAVVTGGERFMNAAPAAMEHALQLGQLLEYIAQSDPNTQPESIIASARNHALETAQQAAIAQGAAGQIATGLDELALQIQAAADMDALVANLDTTGFSADMETLLTDAGLTAAQITTLETNTGDTFQARRVISQTGFLTETVAYLQAGGLTSAQISQIEDEYATYGLADVTLADRLAQLRAGQDEMTLVRVEALQAYTQLLSHQVFLRFQNGQTGRAATPEEIDTLVEDLLRLLTHIGYLNSLAGSGSDPDVGEGQWLFIERYSQQAAGRLETLILETQNVGLVVDLFIVLQIHTTALIAQSGDPVYAKSELDIADDVLAELLGDSLPGSQSALHAVPPLLWRMGLTLSEWAGLESLAWEALPEPEVTADAATVSKELVNARLARLGTTAAMLPLAAGDIQELDETNNVDWLHFYSALPTDQPPGLIRILEGVIPGLQGILDFVWGTITGQSDNPFAIGANIILSFVPVLGELLDLIAIFTEPTVWGKVMALIGLLASILSDGAEILATIGAAIPPTLAATVPGAILLEAIDIGAAILKPINRFVNAQVAAAISRIPFDRVLRLGGDVLTRLARNAIDAVGGASGWPHSIEAAISLIQGLVRSVIDPLSALITRFGDNLNKLYQLGFGDGGYLVGRILHLSDDAASYSDEVLEGIARYGDELANAGVELSDEAAQGLGRLMDELGEADTRRFLNALPCPVASLPKTHLSRIATANNDLFACALEFMGRVGANLTDEQVTGLGKFIKGLADPEAAGALLSNFPVATQDRLLTLLGRSTRNWTANSINGLARMTNDIGIAGIESLATRYSDEVFEQTFQVIRTAPDAVGAWTAGGVEGVAKVIDRFDQALAEEILTRQGRGAFGNTVFDWVNEVDGKIANYLQQPNALTRYREWLHDLSVQGNTYPGTIFELKYADSTLADEGIEYINHYPDGSKGADFIMADGRHIEVKNWTTYSGSHYDDALDQFRRNLGIDANGNIINPGRYGNQPYQYVFRGQFNQRTVTDLCRIAQQAYSAARLTDATFELFTITFLDMPDIFAAGQATAPPGPGHTIVGCAKP